MSDVNRWDNEFRVVSVILFLDGRAKVWFQNHEETIESWEHFKEELLLLFGTTLRRKKKAEAKLETRIKERNETIISSAEDVLRLSEVANLNIIEADTA